MKAGGVARLVGAAALSTWAAPGVAVPWASAEPCPAVEAIFARGTDDPPGLGPVGQAFVDALRTRIGDKTLQVYPVDYPANNNWATGIDGIRDAITHVESTAATCPQTQMVLGGFSQGAAVMGFVTADVIPPGVDSVDVPQPMPPEIADHVAAVVLLATPSERVMQFVGQPPVVIGSSYAAKTIQLCAPEDPICADGLNFGVHLGYAHNEVVDEGATYAADHLRSPPPPGPAADSGSAHRGSSRPGPESPGSSQDEVAQP